MKKFIFLFALALISISACRKDTDTTTTTTNTPIPAQYVKATINGYVVNEDGLPVESAIVHLGNLTVTTDKNGAFRFLEKIMNAKGTYISVEHPLYFHGSRAISLTLNSVNSVRIQLLSNTPTKYLSSASGGTADFGDFTVTLPAGGIVTASGANYTGQVGIAAKWLDPSSDLFGFRMPGRLEGIDANGNLTGMISLGQLAVELTSGSGDKLQIKDGFEAELKMKVPASMVSKAPATIPMWYFDEAKGLWMEEGSATLVNGNYIGKVKHFTFWNWDFYNPTIEVDFKVVDQNGNLLPNIYIDIQASLQGTHGSGSTNSDGHLIGLVPANDPLIAHVYLTNPWTNGNCNSNTPLFSGPIGSFSQDGAYCFTVNITALQFYTITGTLLDCNSNPIANGYVRVAGAYTNNVFYTDANGNYTVTFGLCSAISDVTLHGFDIANLKESDPVIVPLTSNTAQAPPISVCNSLQEYLILNTSAGSITYTQPSAFTDSMTVAPYDITIYAGNQAPYFSFQIPNVSATGTFTPSYATIEGDYNGGLVVMQCNGASCNTFEVILTEMGGPGGYVAGSFSGTLPISPNSPNQPITNQLSGTFRVKLN